MSMLLKIKLGNSINFLVDCNKIIEGISARTHFMLPGTLVYTYFVLTEVPSTDQTIISQYVDFAGVMHHKVDITTSDKYYMIHRFTSYEKESLQNYIDKELNHFFARYPFETRINKEIVEMNYVYKEGHCFACGMDLLFRMEAV